MTRVSFLMQTPGLYDVIFFMQIRSQIQILSSVHLKLKMTFPFAFHLRDLDEDEMEWIGLLRDKVESIMQSQAKYDMETV